MPGREELYDALRKAHAAGDADSAKKLADYIRSLPAEGAAAAPATPAPERTRFEAAEELGRGRPSGFVTPEEFLSLPETQKDLEENGPARLRTFLETAAALGTIPLTGGLGLAARVGIAGLGGAGGSLVSELFDPTPAETTTRDLGQVGDLQLGTVEETTPRAITAGRRAALAGLANAGAELGSSALVGAGRGLARGVLRSKDPARAAAARAIEARGGQLPLAQASGRNVARVGQSVAESSVLGAGRVQAGRAGAIKAATDPIVEAVDTLKSSLSREQLGRTVKEAVEGKSDSFRRAAQAAYSKVDDVAHEVAVDHTAIKAEAARLLKEEPRLSAESSNLLRSLVSDPDQLTFQRAQKIRSALLGTARSSSETIAGQAQGLGKKFSKLLGERMDAAALAKGPEVQQAYRRADQLWKAGKARFNSKAIKGILQDSPTAAVNVIEAAKDPQTVRMIRRTIGNATEWRGVQGELISKLVNESVERSAEGVIKGQNLLNRLDKIGDPVLKELFGAERAATLKTLAKNLSFAQEFTGKAAGGVAVRGGADIAGGTAFVTLLLSGNVPGAAGAAALALTPSAFAHLATNKTAVRLLTQGFRSPPGSRAATRAFTQLGQLVARLGLNTATLDDEPNVARATAEP